MYGGNAKKIFVFGTSEFQTIDDMIYQGEELGQLQKAADSYKQAIHIKPDYVNAHHNLGNIQKKLGKFKEAKKCLY